MVKKIMFVIIFSPSSPKISLYSVTTLLFPDLSKVRMKSEAKENVPTDEARLAAPEMEDAQRQKSSQNETESWSETVPGGAGAISSQEESVLGKRSFPGEMNDRENAGGGTPDRPGRPSVPTPSKGRVVFSTIDHF